MSLGSLTVATVCGKTFAFVGAERTSTIFVFDITDPQKPVLHSHISAAGNTNMAPAAAYALDPEPRPNVNLGQIDPEMMSFDAKRHLLIVSGAFSGTLGVYKVDGLPTCGKPPEGCECIGRERTLELLRTVPTKHSIETFGEGFGSQHVCSCTCLRLPCV